MEVQHGRGEHVVGLEVGDEEFGLPAEFVWEALHDLAEAVGGGGKPGDGVDAAADSTGGTDGGEGNGREHLERLAPGVGQGEGSGGVLEDAAHGTLRGQFLHLPAKRGILVRRDVAAGNAVDAVLYLHGGGDRRGLFMAEEVRTRAGGEVVGLPDGEDPGLSQCGIAVGIVELRLELVDEPRLPREGVLAHSGVAGPTGDVVRRLLDSLGGKVPELGEVFGEGVRSFLGVEFHLAESLAASAPDEERGEDQAGRGDDKADHGPAGPMLEIRSRIASSSTTPRRVAPRMP